MKHSQGREALSISTTDDDSKQAQQMILADRCITINELAYSLEITQDIKSFMMTLGAGKFLQGGCQESLRRTTSKKRLRICQLFLNAATKTI